MNRGRIKLILLGLFCALPVIGSYLAYYVARPQGMTSNYGDLIQPQRPIPNDLYIYSSATQNAQAIKFNTLFPKKWLLISVNRAAICPEACVKKLFFMRQLRLAQGAERTHVIPIWLITDHATVNQTLLDAYGGAYAAGHFLYANLHSLNQWLPVETGHSVESYLYLVDPMGHLMMRFPANPDSKKMHRDLSKLLKWNPISQ